ncbi:hypothetical protein [Rufibacter ruber]|uniref:hypothetical protein n=1 Tax=Rufibacter ruber TaxID=1783499 RepID=UPI000A62F41C|nr:hypothetical protein [Rufibacter ruber]
MKKVLQIILIGVALASCKGKSNSYEQAEISVKLDADSLQRERQRYTIISDLKQVNLVSEGNITLWNPTKEQINQILSLAKKSIAANEDKFSGHLKADSLDRSYKQMIYYVNSKGDSLVFIKELCRVGDYPMEDSTGKLRFYRQDWQNRLILVKDGGDCYWRTRINYSTKKVAGPFTNGEA